jgi:hypothetical protein
MDPLYENLARLIGKALAEKWMAVIARRRAEAKGDTEATNPDAPTDRKMPLHHRRNHEKTVRRRRRS